LNILAPCRMESSNGLELALKLEVREKSPHGYIIPIFKKIGDQMVFYGSVSGCSFEVRKHHLLSGGLILKSLLDGLNSTM